MQISAPRLTPLRRRLARHRRALAAVLAATATGCALLALRPDSASPLPPSGAPAGAVASNTVRDGERTVPIEVASPAIAASVATGDIVDLIGFDADGRARSLAERARILEPARGSSALGAGSAVLLVAVPEADAMAVAAAAAQAPLALLIHPPR